MEPRIDARRHAQEAQKAMYALEQYLAACGLEHSLIHLMKMRASQINGCAYCIDMHSTDARALGETEQRLYDSMPAGNTLLHRTWASCFVLTGLLLWFQTHVPTPSTTKSANTSTKKRLLISLLCLRRSTHGIAWPSPCALSPAITVLRPRPRLPLKWKFSTDNRSVEHFPHFFYQA